jgi:hypothetical protein
MTGCEEQPRRQSGEGVQWTGQSRYPDETTEPLIRAMTWLQTRHRAVARLSQSRGPTHGTLGHQASSGNKSLNARALWMSMRTRRPSCSQSWPAERSGLSRGDSSAYRGGCPRNNGAM